ncbi:antibiotic biosynthesis monooxygenase [Bremerella sp. JC817]|uniref:antibiotic biosynthesis monooxygenase n=1 Tax=Bremerella sp. JC817 TaxID=3231756 RepID=UPI003457F56D
MGQFHIAITHQAKPGKEVEYEAALREFAKKSLDEPGVSGVLLLAPVPGSLGKEYGILRTFDSQESCDAFYHSESYREFHRRTRPLVADDAKRHRLDGLEGFFRDPKTSPPRWKMFVVTWLGVFPSALLFSMTIPPMIGFMHDLLIRAIVNVAVVASLAWVIMPFLTKLFRPWLYPDGPKPVIQDFASTHRPLGIPEQEVVPS